MRESRENRAERLSERAETKRKEAEAITGQAMKMASVIPLGQPILIGHYSERRDRNYREKIINKMRKGAELADYADELERRAEASARNTAIYADALDPVADIDEKIAKLEAERDKYKAIVEADTPIIEFIERMWNYISDQQRPSELDIPVKKALALREKES